MAKITHYRKFITAVSLFTSFAGIAVITGWLLDIEFCKSLLPGFPTMKFNSAICLTFLGFSLLQSLSGEATGTQGRKILALLVTAMGIITLLQHLSGMNIGIDNFFFKYPSPENKNISHPGRMSPQTAFAYMAAGLVLFFIRSEHKRIRQICQYMLHGVTILAFIVLIGYLFRASDMYKLRLISPMALHTAIVLFLFSVAASLVNPKLGITSVFTGNMVGNLMARKLFFYMLFGTIFICYIRILGHWHGLVTVELGIAMTTIAFVLITVILIWITTGRLNNYELKSRIAAENLSVVVQSAPYPIIMTNGRGIIKMANKQTEKLFGYSRNELTGQHMKLLVPEQFHNLYDQNSQKIAVQPGTHTFGLDDDIAGVNKYGREFPVELTVCPIKLRDKLAVVISVIDISIHKHNEAIIKKQLAELQYKNQELEQFNYISSHDLQEPLRTVLNYVELLEEDYPELDNDVKAHHQSIGAAIKRMSLIVKSLLDFGRLGKDKKLANTNMDELLNEVIDDMKASITASCAAIQIVCDLPEIYTYRTQLRQLFQNLLSNAIKFRKNSTVPNVEICAKKIDGYYEFSVEDNGIGIEPKYHDKIFHIFQRLNKEDEYEGHGIGLANVKKIVEMHGGKIWVESAPGKGSIFKFTILNFKP